MPYLFIIPFAFFGLIQYSFNIFTDVPYSHEFFHFINLIAGYFLSQSFNSLPRRSQVVRPSKQSNTDKRRTNRDKIARKDFFLPGVLIEYRSSRVTMIDYKLLFYLAFTQPQTPTKILQGRVHTTFRYSLFLERD